MRKLTCMLLAALLLLAAVPLATQKTAEAATDLSTVRVLLGNSGSNVTSITAAVKGNFFVQETGAQFSGGTLTIKNSGGKVVLSHSSAGTLYSGSSVNVSRESWSPSSGYLAMSANGATRYYLGNFTFKAYGNGLRVVNTVPLQHYLYGVVAFEMSNNFPIEALKAQAVAAKCYVLSGMSPTSDYDIGDTASDQVYKGYNSSYTSVMRAVDETYDVWLYLGSSILCSYFAASNGGQTILPSDTWAGTNRYIWDKAYDRREDPYDIANPLTVQETTFYPANGDSGSISAVLSNYLRNRSTDILRKQYNDPGLVVTYIEAIHSMSSRSTTTADINLTVTAQFSNGGSQSINYAYTEDFAYLTVNGVFTRPQSLRLYVLTQQNDGWLLRRGRYGHGVGLSQRGAEQMANQGMNYQQILKFYYPGADIRSMGLSMPVDPVNPGNTGTPQTPSGSAIATAVTTGNVNFRQGPSTKTSSLGTVPKNTSLNVYAQQDGFSQVQYNNQMGYVSNTYLKITPISSAEQQPSGSTGGVIMYGEVSSSTLNFREQPNTGGKKISTLKKGDKLDIYGYASGGTSWYYCAAGGKTGYVSAQYVKITSQAVADPPPTSGTEGTGGTAAPGSTGTVNQNSIYMRSEASNSSGRRIIGLAKGVTLTITGESGEFYAATITYQGTTYTGYVEKKYVTAQSASVPEAGSSGGSSSTGTQQGETTGKVNFRKGPGTKYSKISQLKKGVKLTILSYSNGWYEVTVDGKTGYVSGDYVKVTSGASSSGNSSSGSTGATVRTGKVIKETTRLRSSASASSNSNILGEYPVGTEMTVHFTEGEFYKVTIGSQEGYMHMDYVEITGEQSAGSSGTTTGNVNFRSGPNTKGTEVYKTVARGTSVSVLGSEGDFYYVQIGSQKGYISKKYISVSGSSSSSGGVSAASGSTTSGVTTGNVRLRTSPDTSSSKNVITQLKKGTKLTIHSTSGGWHLVTAGSNQGYVSAKYVK